MQPNNKPFLVISQSARALASSAIRAGMTVHALDAFGDTDTRAMAVNSRQVQGAAAGFDPQQLLACIQELDPDSLAGIIPGSGFEACPHSIADVQENLPWYGNRPDVWQVCADAHAFSALLAQLGIRHPGITDQLPQPATGWLEKRSFSFGGSHVHFAGNTVAAENTYFQEAVQGRHLSVTFLADGHDMVVAGYCDTLVVYREAGDFRYAGAVTTSMRDTNVIQQLQEMLAGLTQHLGLVGLCGMDVVLDHEGQCWLLELNPRPVATFELHEQENSLVEAHIRACRGQLPSIAPVHGYRGSRVLFAPLDTTVPVIQQWPDWATDRPANGANINQDEPVCTVHARGDSPEQVDRRIRNRADMIAGILAGQSQVA